MLKPLAKIKIFLNKRYFESKIFLIIPNHRNSQLLANLFAQHVINIIVHWNNGRFYHRRHSIASSIASFMFAISSSRVCPWLNASGSCLHCPQYHPVSGFFSMIMLYSILTLICSAKILKNLFQQPSIRIFYQKM